MKTPEQLDIEIEKATQKLLEEKRKSIEYWKDKRTLIEVSNFFVLHYDIVYDVPIETKEIVEYAKKWFESKAGNEAVKHIKKIEIREGNICSQAGIPFLGYFKKCITIKM